MILLLCLTDGAYELAVSYLSSTAEKTRSIQDEKLLCQKIHSRLANKSAKDADKFNECYGKLKNSVSNSKSNYFYLLSLPRWL